MTTWPNLAQLEPGDILIIDELVGEVLKVEFTYVATPKNRLLDKIKVQYKIFNKEYNKQIYTTIIGRFEKLEYVEIIKQGSKKPAISYLYS